MLEFADIDNIDRGKFAVCGTSADPADRSNDPKDAARWPHDRDVRASLIRWLAVNRDAAARVDPKGLRALGARIVGSLDLAQVRVPFPVGLIRCSIPEAMSLDGADIPALDLAGSYTAEISAIDLNAHAFVSLGDIRHLLPAVHAQQAGHGEFRASGVVNLSIARADFFNFDGGHFHYSDQPIHAFGDPALKMALVLFTVDSKNDVTMCCGFESDGAVLVDEATIGGDLNCSGGRFINPNNLALSAGQATITGTVILAPHGYGLEAKVALKPTV
jgi:hypothetical protein